VPLGIQVLSRGIVFIDLAIAQIAGLGVILADSMGLEPQGWAVQAAALTAALAGALLLTWTERRWPEVQEAVIGTTFILAASGALLLLAACYALGAAGYALGLAISAIFDLPSGAVIVWAMALLALPVFACGARGAAAR